MLRESGNNVTQVRTLSDIDTFPLSLFPDLAKGSRLCRMLVPRPLTGSCEPHLCPSFYQTDVPSPTLRAAPKERATTPLFMSSYRHPSIISQKRPHVPTSSLQTERRVTLLPGCPKGRRTVSTGYLRHDLGDISARVAQDSCSFCANGS